MKKILNFLTVKDYTFIDVLGNAMIGALIYNGSWWWMLLLIPMIFTKHILKQIQIAMD